MYLDEILAAQKRGEDKGIFSVCSAHPDVIRQTLKVSADLGIPPLIEATCNQVNQYGGYTGMTPADFVRYVHAIADEVHFPFENILLGGDHLGPSVWQNEPAELAMKKSMSLVHDFVKAGFVKIHLDCSMHLADDPPGALQVDIAARRTAQLAKVAEMAGRPAALRYVIGTEVPVPGGATGHEAGVRVTTVEDARQTIDVTREAFTREQLDSAWDRIVAVVVQPGVEFGDELVLPYQPNAARDLSHFIESQALIYEAHSTDYQARDSLANLVRDHFAILKVGPSLTFAYREAVFALAMIEKELIPEEARSHLIEVLDELMLQHPEHWKKYYHGTETAQAFKRKFSRSDRIRYYWAEARVQNALNRLMNNLGEGKLPDSLLNRFLGDKELTARQVIERKINKVLEDYTTACGALRRI